MAIRERRNPELNLQPEEQKVLSQDFNLFYVPQEAPLPSGMKEFTASLENFVTGGASKAVVYALNKMGIETQYVSRKKDVNNLTYEELTAAVIEKHKLIVNCTPLGTHPNIFQKPNLNYDQLTSAHVLFDLIYNNDKIIYHLFYM